MASFSAISDYFAGFIHASVRHDNVASARHSTFIMSHIVGGALAFAAFPLILLARGGPPSFSEIVILAWLVLPILAALDLSRTGNLDRAQFVSTASLGGLIFAIAAMTGGMKSFALIWLPIVAFEGAFSGSRRVVVASIGVAALVVILLVALDVAGMFHQSASAVPAFLPEIAAMMAVVYTAGLALRWDGVQTAVAHADQNNEARYKLLAENMAEVVTCHTANGAVSFASLAVEQVLGVGTQELQGRGFFERVHVADRPAYLTALSEAAQGGTSKTQFRVRKISPGMSFTAPPQFVRVEMRCRPANGTGNGQIVAVTREIHEPAEQQTDPDRTGVQAESARTAKGTFLASMSHELRTPLNAIIGFSEILANEELADINDTRRQEYAGLIHDSGLHLLAVVNGILDMSRIESGNFSIVAEPFSVKPVIDGCIQLFALKAGKASVRLSTDMGSQLPEMLADKRACKQILINLLSNAIKFTPAGGEIRVSVSEERDMLCIEVSDTGVGIASDDIPNLGNSFFQARSSYDRPYEGTGLGLSVVKGLVGLHGGSFEVQSEVGKGTKVIVKLPRDCRASSVSTEIESPPHIERRVATG